MCKGSNNPMNGDTLFTERMDYRTSCGKRALPRSVVFQGEVIRFSSETWPRVRFIGT